MNTTRVRFRYQRAHSDSATFLFVRTPKGGKRVDSYRLM